MKIRIILFFVLIIVACSGNQSKKETIYYETGEKRGVFIYPNKNDTNTFEYFGYFKDGNLQKHIIIKEGQFDGKLFMYFGNGNIKAERNYLAGKLYGITRDYNKEGELLEENLIINDKPLISVRYYEHPTKPYLMEKIFRRINDTVLRKVGHVSYENDTINQRHSFYYRVMGRDTIVMGGDYDFKIKFLDAPNPYKMRLKLGKLDKNMEFIDSSRVREYHSTDKILHVNLKEVKKGNNLLLGKLYVFPDFINKSDEILKDRYEFIFFHEFYVKEKD